MRRLSTLLAVLLLAIVPGTAGAKKPPKPAKSGSTPSAACPKVEAAAAGKAKSKGKGKGKGKAKGKAKQRRRGATRKAAKAAPRGRCVSAVARERGDDADLGDDDFDAELVDDDSPDVPDAPELDDEPRDDDEGEPADEPGSSDDD